MIAPYLQSSYQLAFEFLTSRNFFRFFLTAEVKNSRAQLFEGRLALNPGLNLSRVSFSGVQKHFLG